MRLPLRFLFAFLTLMGTVSMAGAASAGSLGRDSGTKLFLILTVVIGGLGAVVTIEQRRFYRGVDEGFWCAFLGGAFALPLMYEVDVDTALWILFALASAVAVLGGYLFAGIAAWVVIAQQGMVQTESLVGAAGVQAGVLVLLAAARTRVRWRRHARQLSVLCALAVVSIYAFALGGLFPDPIDFDSGEILRPHEWSSVAAACLLPMAFLAWGVVFRSRIALDAGIASAVVSLIVLPVHFGVSLDLALAAAGLLMVAAAVSVQRWLEAGPSGFRGSFTMKKVFEAASAAWTGQDIELLDAWFQETVTGVRKSASRR